MRPGENSKAIEEAKTIFEAFFEAHPEFVVLLNRQPSLHRDSFQAFHPVPLPPSAGDVIQLCPLTCKGFAADFDGDEMVVHVPLGPEAQEEALRLVPSNNLFSLAYESKGAENVLAHFDQDFVMGTYWLGVQDEVGLRDCFLASLPGDCCRELAAKQDHPRKADGAELLAHIAHKHPRRGVQCHRVLDEGGFFLVRARWQGCRLDSTNLRRDRQRGIRDDSEKIAGQFSDNRNDALQKIAVRALEGGSQNRGSSGDPWTPFCRNGAIRARGAKQVRPIIRRVQARTASPRCHRLLIIDDRKFYFAPSLSLKGWDTMQRSGRP